MQTRIFVHRGFPVGEVDKNVFGGFVEHIGRCVYTGIYEPGHPKADKEGFRQDVIDLVKELGTPVTRYPGGNFVSGFDWKDSIGPKQSRPRRPDYAWKAMETNQFGLDEFVSWCRKADTEPMIAVNLGTNTPKAAQEIVEYCNFPKGSYWSDLRRKNGSKAPHAIKYWCLGNEMDGDWQIGHKTSGEYGRIAYETAKMMKMVDPDIKLCICGSCTRWMPTYGQWDYDILREAYNAVDFLSIHSYFGNPDHDIPNFLAMPEVLERQICDAIAICDAAAAVHKTTRRLMIALDEWNVWYRGDTNAAPETMWKEARPINEEIYDMTDVLVVGGVLQTLLAHADRVKIANIAQTVNIIAPIMTEPGGGSWKQSTFHPFALTSRYGRGTSLKVNVDSPAYKGTGEFKDDIPYLKSAVIHRADASEVVVFAINRSMDEAMDLTVELGGFSPDGIVEAVEIHHDNPDMVNSIKKQNVRPQAIAKSRMSLKDGIIRANLKPFSWNMLRIHVS